MDKIQENIELSRRNPHDPLKCDGIVRRQDLVPQHYGRRQMGAGTKVAPGM